MANPVLVELTRGELVESIHRGSIAIAKADGALMVGLGDVEAEVYPRSSLKPLQALPLVESGAAEAFHLSDEEVALACASHSGEPMHTERVAAWLKRLGLSEADLACGPHAVRYEPVWQAMIARGEAPSRLHNNCSGKHAGFLTLAKFLGAPTAGYERHDHPVQQAVARALAELAGVDVNMPWGVDGCAAPNFAIPLSAFARALAKLADPSALPAPRAAAARRIVKAMSTYPELVSGTGRACAILMRAGRGRFAVKTGAEGVFAGMVPELGIGIALKIDDGAGRASETVIAALLDKLGLLHGDVAAAALIRPAITNTRNAVAGQQRPAAALRDLVV
ncbi:MAG: asparaginase [Alphaproteobacteria bacterium]|nr:asparaginase [Alphaproteobacteria bacterium]MDE2011552.1 asparaginase [Alphaproteobacteria bacterium]MDE2074481.1 asparaginase [Alphaproteobacteria bacterium]MDE2351266.1 asparaginase [Alphaproteobacteria bacterium]